MQHHCCMLSSRTSDWRLDVIFLGRRDSKLARYSSARQCNNTGQKQMFWKSHFTFQPIVENVVFFTISYARMCSIRACSGWKYSPWENKCQILAFEFAVQEIRVITMLGCGKSFTGTWPTSITRASWGGLAAEDHVHTSRSELFQSLYEVATSQASWFSSSQQPLPSSADTAVIACECSTNLKL